MQSQFWSLVRSLGRGRLTRVDDSGPVQLVQMQLSQSETRDSTPRLVEYGFSSNAPEGADAVAVFLAGNRTNGVVVACGHQQYRLRNLASGEVCVSDNRGQSVYLSTKGITVNGGGLPVTIINAPPRMVGTSQTVEISDTVHSCGVGGSVYALPSPRCTAARPGLRRRGASMAAR